MKNLGTPQNFFIVFRGKSINNSHEFCSEAATRGILKKRCSYTPTQMFSCEICETLKKTYFEQHP